MKINRHIHSEGIEKNNSFKNIQKLLKRMVYIMVFVSLAFLTSCINDTAMHDVEELDLSVLQNETGKQNQSVVKAAETEQENLAAISVTIDNSVNKKTHNICF